MRRKKDWELRETHATPEAVFRTRRRFVSALGLGAVGGAVGAAGLQQVTQARILPTKAFTDFRVNPEFVDVGRALTREDKVFRFNNFYEFSLDKRAPIRLCRNFKLDPWKLQIDGLVKKPITLDLDDIRKMGLEQRVYRFRCVEAWAMTLPWMGVPLSSLLALAEPLAEARFISMTSFFDPSIAPRQNSSASPWPYQEGLTIAEAMNPLTFAAVGLYGKMLQPQNGAPFRIVTPWKYGFKGPKSVVKIRLLRSQPSTFWNSLQGQEYGFYGNVNPHQPHPRWSQKREALLGEWGRRVATEEYNGYGRWVADMYSGNEY